VRMVVAGGGTGGHLFPGIAVAEEFKSRYSDAEVLFIGTEKGIEARVVPREGLPIRFLKAEGVLGKSPLKKLLAIWRLLGSLRGARTIFNETRPDVVVGTGGYVSAGPVACARLMSIPTLILEQNMVPGLANRVLSRMADTVAVTYHESMSFFPRAKTYLTGNPVRWDILRGSRQKALEMFSLDQDKVTVFVSGGSSGSRNINNAMVNALNYLLDIKEEVQFLHQTGEKDYEGVRKAYRKSGFTAMVVPFIYQMAEAYATADIAVLRAGATTLAEITALGKPAIIIPYPHAAGHQEFNARKLLEIGACMMIPDHELSGELLAGHIRELSGSEEKRAEMRAQSRALGRPDAARKVVDIAVSLVKARGHGPGGHGPKNHGIYTGAKDV
jgi:UDP-N-acetylglucosamine--N-acetylmuramyl-(pentapeptide) pyrophosphoryl-undecaprenol N-acetylglucosamine transferase